jgi:hypothetical protein
VGVVGSVRLAEWELPPRGLETAAVTTDSDSSLRNPPTAGAANSGAVSTVSCPVDSDLAEIIAAWDVLPGAIRAGIVAMVQAAAGKTRQADQ